LLKRKKVKEEKTPDVMGNFKVARQTANRSRYRPRGFNHQGGIARLAALKGGKTWEWNKTSTVDERGV